MADVLIQTSQFEALLRGSVTRFNEWRARNPAANIDLSGADLRGANLVGANLCCANLRGVQLSGAHIAGADFRRARLDESTWQFLRDETKTTLLFFDGA